MTKTSVAFYLIIVFLASQCAFAGESIVLARGTVPHQPQQPQVAVDAQAAIHVVFGVGNEIRYCRSEDGKTFSEPSSLPAMPTMALGMRRGPRIAVTKSAICVTAIGGKQGKGRDGDLLAMRSVDGGKTWLDAVSVNDVESAAREGLHAMAAGPNDSVCCVWLDLRKKKTEVMASTSADGGKTWGKNTLVYQSPDGSVRECCHPSVVFDSKGQIFVQWRNSLAGARDIYVASSSDGGKTFGKATKLGTDSWPLNACPMDGGAIAIGAAGKVASVWRRDQAVFLVQSGRREEQRLGGGEQPWVAATSEGPFVVWLESRNEAALLLAPGSTSPVELAAHANNPAIAAGPSGKGPVVAVWETREGKNQTIQCQVVQELRK